MESVAEVPEEASGLRQPRFWIRVFLLLDRLPPKANEPCLPNTHTHTHTHKYTPVDGSSMNEECEAVTVDHQVCAVRFLT